MNFTRLNLRKSGIFLIVMVGVPLVFTEVLVRAYFATQVGSRVFLYGTPLSRHQEKFDPIGAAARKARDESTVVFHDNVVGAYSKYFPNQRLTDRDEFGNVINVSINSRGFRGDDFEIKKAPNVIRVVTLGASSTFGYKDHDDQTYPNYMQQLLNEALLRPGLLWNGRPVKAFEVINLGVPHLRTEQIYSLFLNEGLELEPDFVTFYEGINDAVRTEPSDTVTEGAKKSIKSIPLANEVFREIRYRSLAVAFIGAMISQVKTEYSLADFELYRRGKREQFLHNLRLLHDACKGNGIQLIVANQQATNMEENREKLRGLEYEAEQAMVRQKAAMFGSLNGREVAFLVHKELMDAQREWARASNIPYADVITALDLNRESLVTWVHLNAAGNKVVAGVLAREILKRMAGRETAPMGER